jgi:hypothetical protein
MRAEGANKRLAQFDLPYLLPVSNQDLPCGKHAPKPQKIRQREVIMSERWVKCTDSNGAPLYINLGEAVTMRRQGIRGKEVTVILFQRTTAEVVETPDQILTLKAL